MTWSNRGLWVVGLFAGSAGGSSIGFNVNIRAPYSDPSDPFASFLDANLDKFVAGVQAFLPEPIVIGVVLAVIGLGLWLLSVTCEAAVIAGGAETVDGQPTMLSATWSAGLSAYARLFRLRLEWLLLWIVVIGLILLGGVHGLF
jgi:hypothetical protein